MRVKWVCEAEFVEHWSVGCEVMKCGEYTHSHKFTMYLETSKVGLCLSQSVAVCSHWNQLLCPLNPVLKVEDLLGSIDHVMQFSRKPFCL